MKIKNGQFALHSQNKMIGLFLGDTDFPKKILNKIKKLKKKYFIIDLSSNSRFKKDKNSYVISIGQFGKIINLIKDKKCNKVLFAGKINKPRFSSLRLDFKGLYYIPRIIKASKLGDAAILKEIIKILAKEKIKVISSILQILGSLFSILKELIPSREFKTGKKGAEKDVNEKIIEDVRLAEVLRRNPDSELARRVLSSYRQKDTDK